MLPSSHKLAAGEKRARPDLADIFRRYGESYRRDHALPASHKKVMRAVETCRTAELGGHLKQFDTCSFEHPSYNSCRNRHCPKCQSLAKAQWLQKQSAELLPVGYFHLVFTLPHELNRLILTQKSLDHSLWIDARPNFLFPVEALSQVFRGKFLALLKQNIDRGKIAPSDMALSNDRILNIENGRVLLSYRDRKDGDRKKILVLDAHEFVRRFLLHVLPDGFVRIRHFGFLANRAKKQALARCRTLLDYESAERPSSTLSARDLPLKLTGVDLTRCPYCHKGTMITVGDLPASPRCVCVCKKATPKPYRTSPSQKIYRRRSQPLPTDPSIVTTVPGSSGLRQVTIPMAATSVRLHGLVQHVLSPLLNQHTLFRDLIASKH